MRTSTSARGQLAVLAHLALLLVLLAATPSSAQLVVAEEGKLRLVYFDGIHSYLVPHVTRSFLNSLRAQEKLLGFESREQITVFLADFSDKGNAGAFAIPRNAVTIQLAPLSFAYETFVTNERMIAYMNHELVHVATLDLAGPADRRFRGLFRGKVTPIAAQPETILYQVLTSPRADSPRWYFEGSAVFLETWMAAGLGRAQSGYYEMVFRSMVNDGTPFYDPLGLVSEANKIDFQVEANSYLYGTRFFTWLADRYSPEQVLEWLRRSPGSRAYYSAQFQHVFGTSVDRAWAEWVASEQAFQRTNLESIRKYPVTPYRDVSPRALGIRLASLLRSGHPPDLRGRVVSGRALTHRRNSGRWQSGQTDCRRQGPEPVDRGVAGLGSRQPHALLYKGQRAASQHRVGRSGDRTSEGRAREGADR